MPGPNQFLPSSAIRKVLGHDAVEDVTLGSPSRNTEMIIVLNEAHPICKAMAPKRLGGCRVIINHYANGVRFNWKDAELDFQHVEYIGQHPGMMAIQAELCEDLVANAFDLISPRDPTKPFLGDMFITHEDFRRLYDHVDVAGYGVSHFGGRTSLAVKFRPESRFATFFPEENTSFEILFDANSLCCRWYNGNGGINWDSISASSPRNIAELNSIFGDPVAHMEKLLRYGTRAAELEKANDQKLRNRRRAAFQAQFEGMN